MCTILDLSSGFELEFCAHSLFLIIWMLPTKLESSIKTIQNNLQNGIDFEMSSYSEDVFIALNDEWMN